MAKRMSTKPTRTFVVDCPRCKAKVAAEESGLAERSYFDQDAGEPFAERIHVGDCHKMWNSYCGNILPNKIRRFLLGVRRMV
jgi:hypothetical protein